jgi:hypothetical protein
MLQQGLFAALNQISMNNQRLEMDSCGGVSGIITPVAFCGLGLVTVSTNLQTLGGVACLSNNLPVTAILSTITNGGFWLGSLSNKLIAVGMSNNVATFTEIAPKP